MTKIIVSFDFGTKKIGVAVGNSKTRTASPLTIIKSKEGIPNWQKIGQIIKEWHPNLLLVGLPLNMDMKEGLMVNPARCFAENLQNKYKLDVELVDERLTSSEARLINKNFLKNKNISVDDIAAMLIIETWFTENN